MNNYNKGMVCINQLSTDAIMTMSKKLIAEPNGLPNDKKREQDLEETCAWQCFASFACL